jgi:hypothetical protein
MLIEKQSCLTLNIFMNVVPQSWTPIFHNQLLCEKLTTLNKVTQETNLLPSVITQIENIITGNSTAISPL